VEELGYVPHAGARSLSLARTGAIGVVLPNLHGEFFSEIVRGMDRVATERGYLLLLSNMHSQGGNDQAVIRALHGRVDGLIVMAPHLDDEQFATALPRGIPTVLVNSRAKVGTRPTIHLDNAAGARAVARHLIDIGRRRIVHIAGPIGNIDAEERAEAFARELRTQPAVEFETVQGNFYEESGASATLALVRSGRRFDAIFAGNDMMAIGALEALRGAAIPVPEQVAVAGFDDVPLASHLGLTTVRVRIAELGERAIDRLIAILDGQEDQNTDELHAPELVLRGSTLA
jgi:LacI family transcriptional regulator